MSSKEPKKRHRLPHGQGSFYYRDRDGRWVGAVMAGWSRTGARRRIVITDKDEDKAWAKLQAKRKAILAEGIPAEGMGGNASVESWCKSRLERRKDELKPKPFISERSAVQKWIIPTLGHRRLADLTPGDVRDLGSAVARATYRGRQLTATYANKVQSVFLEYMTAASVEGHPVPQRIFKTILVSKSVNDRTAIPLAETLRILQAARASGDDYSRWDAAFLQALRQGEALGLTREFVDFQNHTITIWWELAELTRDPDAPSGYHVPSKYEARQLDGRFWLLEPKSKGARRVIPMIPAFEQSLRRWFEVMPESEHGLVWARPNGMPRIAAQDRAQFKEYQDLAEAWKAPGDEARGVKPVYYVPHEARHTTVSLLLELEVPREVIEAIVGHVKLVDNYVHVSDLRVQKALAQLGEVLQLDA